MGWGLKIRFRADIGSSSNVDPCIRSGQYKKKMFSVARIFGLVWLRVDKIKNKVKRTRKTQKERREKKNAEEKKEKEGEKKEKEKKKTRKKGQKK